MILLTSTTDELLIVTGAAVNTINVQATFVDLDGLNLTPNRKNTLITTATTTVVVPSPPASTQRALKNLCVYNSSASPCDVTIQHTDGTTDVDIFNYTMATDESIYWSEGRGFYVVDALGNTKVTTAGVGPTGPAGPQGPPGTSGVLSVQTRLTASQFGNCATTPVEVLPAQGAGFAIVPVSVQFVFFPGTQWYGAYNASGQLGLSLGGTWDIADPPYGGATPTTAPSSTPFQLGFPLSFAGLDNADLKINSTLDPITFGAAASVSIFNGGTGYAPGDTGAILDVVGDGGESDEVTYTVDTVDGGGAILTFTVNSYDGSGGHGGGGYQAGQQYNDDPSEASGSGTGAVWTVNTITPGNGTCLVVTDYNLVPTS